MKQKIPIFMVFLLLSLITTMRAQTATVTLSTNGELKSFGAYGILDAIDAANPNDTIWLSSGHFVERNELYLTKPLVFIGSGAIGDNATQLSSSNIRLKLDSDSSIVFEGIDILAEVQVYGDGNIIFRNSQLERLYTFHTSDYIISPSMWLDRCKVTGNIDLGTEGALNINNSIIDGNCWSYNAYTNIVNCSIKYCYISVTGTVSNSLLNDWEDRYNVTFQDCVLSAVYSGDMSKAQYINCSTPLNENGEAIQPTPENAELYNWLGSDGTLVGPYGGTTPFSLLPSYPTPDPSNSTLEYDKNTHKLKVKVSILDD